jgi:hypothetical protein
MPTRPMPTPHARRHPEAAALARPGGGTDRSARRPWPSRSGRPGARLGERDGFGTVVACGDQCPSRLELLLAGWPGLRLPLPGHRRLAAAGLALRVATSASAAASESTVRPPPPHAATVDAAPGGMNGTGDRGKFGWSAAPDFQPVPVQPVPVQPVPVQPLLSTPVPRP